MNPATSGVILEINVHPGSRKSFIKGFDPWRNRIDINVAAPPLKGKANEEVIELLALTFKLGREDVEIISGKKSTMKKILLRTADVEEVIEILEAVIE